MPDGATVHHLIVEAALSDSARLDRWLAAALPGLSRTRIRRLIEAGMVSLGGKTITEPSQRVKPGSAIVLHEPKAEAAGAPGGQAIPLAVVFEDADLIVIDKPAGLVVHPAPGNPDRTLVNALIAHCGASLSGVGGVLRPGIVHRLDKDTSGLLVAAKHDASHRALSAQFAARSAGRVYLAVVHGVPHPAQGEIEGAIGRSPRNRQKMALVRRGGRPALTRYRVLRRFAEGAFALVECRLATGRTHQVRVHLAARGHPLVGDPLYGGGGRRKLARNEAARLAAANFPRQALHAKTLSFDHPRSGLRLTFEAPMPTDFAALIVALEQS